MASLISFFILTGAQSYAQPPGLQTVTLYEGVQNWWASWLGLGHCEIRIVWENQKITGFATSDTPTFFTWPETILNQQFAQKTYKLQSNDRQETLAVTVEPENHALRPVAYKYAYLAPDGIQQVSECRAIRYVGSHTQPIR